MNKIFFSLLSLFVLNLSNEAFSQQQAYWIDSFHVANNKTVLGDNWFSFTDQSGGGASSIHWSYEQEEASANQVLKFSYLLEKKKWTWAPYVTLGCNLSYKKVNLEEVKAIAYRFKGSAHSLIYKTNEIKDYAFYQKAIAPSDTWNTVVILLSELQQPSWGKAIPFKASDVHSLLWQVQGENGDSGEVYIDDIRLLTQIDDSSLTVDQRVTLLNENVAKERAGLERAVPLLSIAQQKTEFYLLKEKLEYRHPSLYRFTAEKAMQDLFASTEKKLNKERSPYEFHKLIRPLFLAIRDAHTHVFLSKDSLAKPPLFFPLDVKIINERLYIYQNLSDRNDIPEGAEIRTINGVKAQTIIQELKKVVGVDGYIETTKQRVVESWFCFFYPAVYGHPATFTIQVINKGKKLQLQHISGLTEKTIDARKAEPHRKPSVFADPFYSFHVLEEKKTAVLKIGYFAVKTDQEYATFIDSCFAELEKQKITNLIIDLRWNIGGPRNRPIYLYSKLATQPFNCLKSQEVTGATLKELLLTDRTLTYETIRPNLYRIVHSSDIGRDKQQPAKNNYSGKVFLLLDGQSNSASCIFAGMFRQNKRGTIVGEEAGCVYNGFASGLYDNFTLPYSNMAVQIPKVLQRIDIDETLPAGHGIIPDYIVKESNVEKILRGGDEVLDFTLDLIE